MAGLGNAVAQHAAPRPFGPMCRVGQLFPFLDDEDAADLRRDLLGQIPARGIVDGIAKWRETNDIPLPVIKTETVKRHRRRMKGQGDGCSCPV